VTAVSGGVWAVTGGSLLSPFDPSMAHPVTDSALYSGRLVRDPDGCWVLLAFRNFDAHGAFIGELSDPMPVELTSAGQLQLAGRPQANELICQNDAF